MTRPRQVLSSIWVKALLSAALLAAVIVVADTSELASALARADARLVALAFVLWLASQALSAYRWRLLALPLGFRDPFLRYLQYYFAGMYLNFFAPSTLAGDVGRSLFLARGRKRALAFSSVIADRAIGFVALVWIGALGIVLVRQPTLPFVLRWCAWLVPPVTFAAWMWAPRLVVRRLAPGNRWRVLVEKNLAPYWHDGMLLIVSLATAGAFHVLQIASQVALARALHLPIPLSFFFVFVPVVNIAGMLPVSMNGVGIREFGYWYFLTMVGIDRESAIALGILASGVVLATGLLGAPILPFVRAAASAGNAPPENRGEAEFGAVEENHGAQIENGSETSTVSRRRAPTDTKTTGTPLSSSSRRT